MSGRAASRRRRRRRGHPAVRPHVPARAPQAPPADAPALRRVHTEAGCVEGERGVPTRPPDQHLHGRARLAQVARRGEGAPGR